MTDSSWSDYVFEAGTDPSALDTASDTLGTTADATAETLEWTDTSGLEQPVVDAIQGAGSDAADASGWQSFAEGDLRDAAGWEDAAQGRIDSAMEWLAYGNVDAAQQEFAAAETASGIAQEEYGSASVDLGIAAEYMDSSAAGLDAAASVDSSGWDTSSTYDATAAVDTSSYDSSASYDSGGADAGA
jgi:hypothetical protein